MYNKKQAVLSILLMLFLLSFASCNEQKRKEPQNKKIFNISSASFDSSSTSAENVMSISAEEAIAYIDFECTEPWKATRTGDWFTLSPEKGGPGTIRITVEVESNMQETPRSGKITLEAEKDIVEISIFQQKLYKDKIMID